MPASRDGAGAPTARTGHSVTWTPAGMSVWGGHGGRRFDRRLLVDGARYTP
jgi:hypothetical protein